MTRTSKDRHMKQSVQQGCDLRCDMLKSGLDPEVTNPFISLSGKPGLQIRPKAVHAVYNPTTKGGAHVIVMAVLTGAALAKYMTSERE